MNIFSPKTFYQTYQATLAEEHARQSDKPWLIIGLVYALSQVAATGASEQELNGARRLIQAFLNLPDKADDTPKFPTRNLPSFDTPGFDGLKQIAQQLVTKPKQTPT